MGSSKLQNAWSRFTEISAIFIDTEFYGAFVFCLLVIADVNAQVAIHGFFHQPHWVNRVSCLVVAFLATGPQLVLVVSRVSARNCIARLHEWEAARGRLSRLKRTVILLGPTAWLLPLTLTAAATQLYTAATGVAVPVERYVYVTGAVSAVLLIFHLRFIYSTAGQELVLRLSAARPKPQQLNVASLVAIAVWGAILSGTANWH